MNSVLRAFELSFVLSSSHDGQIGYQKAYRQPSNLILSSIPCPLGQFACVTLLAIGPLEDWRPWELRTTWRILQRMPPTRIGQFSRNAAAFATGIVFRQPNVFFLTKEERTCSIAPSLNANSFPDDFLCLSPNSAPLGQHPQNWHSAHQEGKYLARQHLHPPPSFPSPPSTKLT